MNSQFGWNPIINSKQKDISKLVTNASINNGATSALGTIIYNTEFNTPTGGTWVASPISINAEPTIGCVNPHSPYATTIVSDSLNMRIKKSYLTGPMGINNNIFSIGNPIGKYDFINTIPINLGASNYTKFMISFLENSIKSSDAYGNISAVDFDRTQGPFTGVWNLLLMLSNTESFVDLGIRLESSTNQSSIYHLRINLSTFDVYSGELVSNEQNSNDIQPFIVEEWKDEEVIYLDDGTVLKRRKHRPGMTGAATGIAAAIFDAAAKVIKP